HIFCQSCLCKHLAREDSCPSCRYEIITDEKISKGLFYILNPMTSSVCDLYDCGEAGFSDSTDLVGSKIASILDYVSADKLRTAADTGKIVIYTSWDDIGGSVTRALNASGVNTVFYGGRFYRNTSTVDL